MEIREKLENAASGVEARVRPEVDVVKERLAEVNAKVVSFIKAYPAQCLVGAVAIGFLVGRIASSGSSRHAAK